MPYRTREHVERWVAEFQELGHGLEVSFTILDHDTDQGESTALVSLVVDGSRTRTSISPSEEADGRWIVTFESRAATVELSAEETTQLATTVTAIAALCSFLEEKSLAYLASRTR